jgi:hypothetical protein
MMMTVEGESDAQTDAISRRTFVRGLAAGGVASLAMSAPVLAAADQTLAATIIDEEALLQSAIFTMSF